MRKEEQPQKVSWKDWNPGLDNGEQTLQQVLDTLPGVDPQEVSFLVRLIENPDSPFALSGAVTLDRHDCIHIVLGRGLLSQDEAFVIGFTMGTSKDISRFEEYFFKKMALHLYPKQYRFTKQHLKVYELALESGKLWGPEKLFDFPFEDYHDWKLGDVRKRLGIDVAQLRELYEYEQKLLPNTVASKRLPVI